MSGAAAALTPTATRSVATTLARIVGVAVLLAAASQVAIPLPGTPVPITLQPFVVVLAGFWLGPVQAAASMALYLLAGALGAPVFAPLGPPGIARLLGPTGGYLLAYPLAAYTAGWLGARATAYSSRVLAALAAILVLYAGGALQLLVLTGSVRAAIGLGIMPFVVLDVVKAHLAALAAPRQGRRARA